MTKYINYTSDTYSTTITDTPMHTIVPDSDYLVATSNCSCKLGEVQQFILDCQYIVDQACKDHYIELVRGVYG